MNELELFYYRALSELEKIKGVRCYNERTLCDWKGKRMRRKLEKGYIAGVKSAIKALKKVKMEFYKDYANNQVEDKERTFIQ